MQAPADMPVDHYENFPVASILAPRRYRPAIEAVYRFARTADDVADEGHASNEERLATLARFSDALDQLFAGHVPQEPSVACLSGYMASKASPNGVFPMALFKDLLSAFAQDVTVKRYATFADLQDYCRRSANPVGRLLLHLYDQASEQNLQQSDAICTSLQLINFWQDVSVDWQKQRVYLPQDSLAQCGVSEAHIANGLCDSKFIALMKLELNRAKQMMLAGAPLARQLPGRVGWELRLVVQGGLRIIEKIEHLNYDVLHHRPVLRARDWALMLWRALFNTMDAQHTLQESPHA